MIKTMWRMARPDDDEFVVEMCLELYREDAGLWSIPAEHMRTTLAMLRREPWRGQAVVLEVDGRPCGYALLIDFWSNEFGGNVCEVDERFVAEAHRNRGHGKALMAAIAHGDLSPAAYAGIALNVLTSNEGARRLYERLGFVVTGHAMVCRLP